MLRKTLKNQNLSLPTFVEVMKNVDGYGRPKTQNAVKPSVSKLFGLVSSGEGGLDSVSAAPLEQHQQVRNLEKESY